MFEFYTHYQEIPQFSIYWRLKTCKQTFDIALIFKGRWYGCLINY